MKYEYWSNSSSWPLLYPILQKRDYYSCEVTTIGWLVWSWSKWIVKINSVLMNDVTQLNSLLLLYAMHWEAEARGNTQDIKCILMRGDGKMTLVAWWKDWNTSTATFDYFLLLANSTIVLISWGRNVKVIWVKSRIEKNYLFVLYY